MPKVTDDFRNAQILAEFCKLEPGQAEYFRNNYPDFAPPAWWDKKVPVLDRATERNLRKLIQEREWSKEELREKLRWIDAEAKSNRPENQWQITQAYLRDWWKSSVKDDVQFLVVLLNSVFDPSRTEFTQMLRWMKRLYSSGSNLQDGYIPMQGAIVYLFANPWRARFCPVCHKPFVAGESKTKFCSTSCSDEDRRRQKREWARENLSAWRRKQKAKTKKRGGK